MSLFRSAMERGFDLLKAQAGDTVEITRNGETIAVSAIGVSRTSESLAHAASSYALIVGLSSVSAHLKRM